MEATQTEKEGYGGKSQDSERCHHQVKSVFKQPVFVLVPICEEKEGQRSLELIQKYSHEQNWPVSEHLPCQMAI